MSRFHNLADRLGTQPPAPPPRAAVKPAGKERAAAKPKTQDFKEGYDAGFAAANARQAKVRASADFARNPGYGEKLLTKPALSGDDIVELLASTPAASAPRRRTMVQVDAVWDRARQANGAAAANAAQPRKSGADAPWERAAAANGRVAAGAGE